LPIAKGLPTQTLFEQWSAKVQGLPSLHEVPLLRVRWQQPETPGHGLAPGSPTQESAVQGLPSSQFAGS
jgi:hypothetical protein